MNKILFIVKIDKKPKIIKKPNTKHKLTHTKNSFGTILNQTENQLLRKSE